MRLPLLAFIALSIPMQIACSPSHAEQPVTKNGPALIAAHLNQALDSLNRRAEEVPEMRKGCQELKKLSQQVHRFAQTLEKHANLQTWPDSADMRRTASKIANIYEISLFSIYYSKRRLNEGNKTRELKDAERLILEKVLKAGGDIAAAAEASAMRFEELERRIASIPPDSVASAVKAELRNIQRSATEQIEAIDKKCQHGISRIALLVGLSRAKL